MVGDQFSFNQLIKETEFMSLTVNKECNSQHPLTFSPLFCFRLLQIFISNMKFDVEFTLNRYPLRLQHRALDLAAKHELEEVLFPSGAAAASLPMPKLRSGGHYT